MLSTIFGFGAAIAAEVPPISPSEFVTNDSVTFIWSLLAQPEIVALIVSAISGLVGIILRNHYVKKWRMERAIEFLAAGVRETYEGYVRHAKKANEDGKLTVQERDEALRKAIEKGQEYCKNHGFDLMKVYAKEFIPVIVQRIVGSQKIFGRSLPPFSENLAPPLPDLSPR